MTVERARSWRRTLFPLFVALITALAWAVPGAAWAQGSGGPIFEFAADGGYELGAGAVRLSVAGDGSVAFSAASDPDAPAGFRLESIGFGDEPRTSLAGAGLILETPQRLAIRRGSGLDEIYEPRPTGVEQTFKLYQLPAAAPGDLVLEARFETALTLSLLGPGGADGVALKAGPRTVLHYGAATVIDASGRSAAARMEVSGDLVRIMVGADWVASASLPLTIDPLVSGSLVVVSTATSVETRTDCAYSVTQDAYIVVYDDEIPGGGHAIMAGRFRAADGTALDPVSATTSAFVVTSTAGVDAISPRVAWLGGGEDRYLVAWLDKTHNDIRGAIIEADTTVTPTITALTAPIATTGTSEIEFTDLAVGGRLEGGSWLVAFSVTRTSAMGQVDVKGQLVDSSGPVGNRIDLSSTSNGNPKGQAAVNRAAGAGQPWLVAWSQQSGNYFHIMSATVTAVGRGGIRTFASQNAIQERPAVAGAEAPWLVTFGYVNASGDRDIKARLADVDGSTLGASASAVAVSATADDRTPAAAVVGDDYLIAWMRAATTTATTGTIVYSRYDNALNLLEGPIEIETAPEFQLPSAVGRDCGPGVTLAAEYLVACDHVLSSGGDVNPRFSRVAGNPSAVLEVREGSVSGAVISNGQSASGTSERYFGGVQTGTAVPLTIVISNVGAGSIKVQPPAFTGTTSDFSLSTWPSLVTLNAGQSEPFTVTFNPTSPGVKSAFVSFVHDAISGLGGTPSPFTFEVRGVGLAGAAPATDGAKVVTPAAAISAASTTVSTITLPWADEVLSVTLTVNASHPAADELAMSLTGPTGVTIALKTDGAPSGGGFVRATFDDAAATGIRSAPVPVNGTYRPEQALRNFRGLASGGDWTLRIDNVGSQTGSFDGWSIHVETAPLTGPGLQVFEGSASGPPIANGAPAAGGRAFGQQVIGAAQKAEVEIAIVNSGVATLTLGTPATTTADFAIDTTSTNFMKSVSPGRSTSFKVIFDPKTAGAKTDTVTFANNVMTAFSFDVSGTGVVPQPRAFVAGGLPVVVPDGSPSGPGSVASTVFCTLGGNVLGVSVTALNIAHIYDEDLRIFLVGPTGVTVELSRNRGGAGQSYVNTAFDDQAATPIAAGAPPFTGAFQPEQPLSAFVGHPANGPWTLEVFDDFSGYEGSLLGWTLKVNATEAGVATAAVLVTDGPNGPQIANGLSGAGALDLGVGIIGLTPTTTRTIVVENAGAAAMNVTMQALSNPTDFTISAPGFPATIPGQQSASFDLAFDPTATGQLSSLVSFTHDAPTPTSSPFAFEVRGIGAGSVVSVSATGLPLAIPDYPGGGVQSSVTVGGIGDIVFVRVRVAITHTYDSDLDLVLTPPTGTSIVLASGAGGIGDNFANTTFDDSAPIGIANGAPPFAGHYRPAQPFSGLIGQPAAGTWRLSCTDIASGNVGTLTAWSLEIGVPPAPVIDVREHSAVGPPVISGQTTIAFADRGLGQGPSAAVTVVVRNTGNATLTLSVPTLSPAVPAFSLNTAGFATAVSKGGQTSFTIAFDPSAAGTVTANVTFSHDAPTPASPFFFGLSGRGVETRIEVRDGAGGPLLASGDTVDLGNQGTADGPSAPRLIEIRCAGIDPLTVGMPVLGGPDASVFTLDTGAFTKILPGGATTAFGIRFDPSTDRPYGATVSFSHDGAGQPSPYTLNLAGTGVPSVASGGGGGGGGGGGCSTGGRPDTTTPVIAAALLALSLVFRRRRRRTA